MPKATTTVSSARRKSWHRKAVLASATVALVAGAVAVLAPGEADPVDRATEFLAAVRAKDVDRAYQLSSIVRPGPNNRGRFLTARAMRADWQVSSVEEESGDADTAVVRYRLIGAGRTVDGVLELTHDEVGGWRVANPTVLVAIPYTPFRSLRINGLHVERTYQDSAEARTFALLPGVYEFPVQHVAGDPAGEPLVELVTDRHLGEPNPPRDVVPPYALGANWWSAVAGGVQSVLDSCVQRTEVGLPGCPFGAPEPFRRSDGTELTDPTDVRWELVEPPLLDENPDLGTVERDALTLSSPGDAPGIARLTFSGETPTGRRVRINCDSEIDLRRLAAGVEADGTVVVDDARTRYERSPRSPFPCREQTDD